MKKTSFNISLEEDKAAALVLYLSQKNATVEAELERALDTLYTKTVPVGVREFIEMKPGIAPKSRKAKASSFSAVGAGVGSDGDLV